jgi:hypothetical protein
MVSRFLQDCHNPNHLVGVNALKCLARGVTTLASLCESHTLIEISLGSGQTLPWISLILLCQFVFAGLYSGPDAFVSKISADGKSLIYSTYYGGTGAEAASVDEILYPIPIVPHNLVLLRVG